MNVARQLYQLQETEQELASAEQTRAGILARLGENKDITGTRDRLAGEKKQFEEMGRRLHTVEWEIEDFSVKIKKFEDSLYSGKTSNPKELSGIQQEIESLKARKLKLEDSSLELMEEAEAVENSISGLESRLRQLEAGWQVQQKELAVALGETEKTISALGVKRALMASELAPELIGLYMEIKKQRGTSVAKVEQGICRGCRISLPVNELQQVRSGELVRCGSCGRILLLA